MAELGAENGKPGTSQRTGTSLAWLRVDRRDRQKGVFVGAKVLGRPIYFLETTTSVDLAGSVGQSSKHQGKSKGKVSSSQQSAPMRFGAPPLVVVRQYVLSSVLDEAITS
ncbi:hypothetical protein NCU17167 [Neurospora crassa OR74A]|uniref:Uncharacterized protein n=1 Tax=Neurospora crassa (strain ATCC 24698 / 74-OR23-1A / CBS 708.71 / DSM 1257 / FGSC 987) TaxID=367110 RepID=V5IM69_NEUCR|nr:hypothetical protein NCU17167 [Neurospora crassa OR74A]ESA41816.1 hypothetical protein NCU17167 [Neurospora crassa OR74A]|eukprot:XP_011395348.1 hypothetical protein NCU17167 [Neurospora crassa OR74A]